MQDQDFSFSSSLAVQFPDILSSFLLLLSTSAPEVTEGILTNVSLEPTWRWYFAMTPFETCFLGLILSQFAVLNLFGIFPLNLAAFVNGMPSGRKKRDTLPVSREKRDIARQLLKLMKKLDPDECSFKALCELESQTCMGNLDIPKSILFTLKGLKRTAEDRRKGVFQLSLKNSSLAEMSDERGITEDEDSVIIMYEEAVKTGGETAHNSLTNSSICDTKYSRCPVNAEEIMSYVKIMQSVDELYSIL